MRRLLASLTVAVLAVLPIAALRPAAAATSPALLAKQWTVEMTPSLCIDYATYGTYSVTVTTAVSGTTCIYQAIGVKCNDNSYYQQPSWSYPAKGSSRTYNPCGSFHLGICYVYFQGEDYRGVWGDRVLWRDGHKT